MASLIVWPIDTFGSSQGMAELHWDGVFDVTPGSSEPVIRRMIALAFIIVAPIVLNAVGLFTFKKRQLQMKLVGIAAGIEICVGAVLVYISTETGSGMGAEWHFCIRWMRPVAAAILAYQGLGIIVEWAMTESLVAALQDVSLGLPGILIQVIAGYKLMQKI